MDLHGIIRVILIGRESTQLGYSQQVLWEEMVTQRHNYFLTAQERESAYERPYRHSSCYNFFHYSAPNTESPFLTHPVSLTGYYAKGLAAFWRQAQFSERPFMAEQKQRERESLLGASYLGKAPRQI